MTEEQDLQVMVMMSQKNSPVQYVHASAMQHRVRAAVAQSQVHHPSCSRGLRANGRHGEPPEKLDPSVNRNYRKSSNRGSIRGFTVVRFNF